MPDDLLYSGQFQKVQVNNYNTMKLTFRYVLVSVLFVIVAMEICVIVRNKVYLRKSLIISGRSDYSAKLNSGKNYEGFSTQTGMPKEADLVADLNAAKMQYARYTHFTYPEFEITEPNFVSDELRQLFRKDKSNVEVYGIPTADKLKGEVYVIQNGTFTMPYDCGYRSNVDFVLKDRVVPAKNWYRSLAPLIIPDGWSFQHFMDGTLPKVIQAISYLQRPEVKVLLQSPRDKIIFEILEKLNITKDKIVIYSSGTFGADYLIFSCITPPLHPVLWQKARALLGAPGSLEVSWDDAYVVVVTRTGCFNCGRRFTNMDAIVDLLNSRYGNATVKLFKGPYDLEQTIEMFGKAKLVIGAHGGGMVNVVFSPKDTNVIEIMPTDKNGRRLFRGADKMIWIQSVLMGQTFWRLPSEPLNPKGDMDVDLKELSRILDQVHPK